MLRQVPTSTMRMKNFTLGAATGSRILQNVDVQLLIRRTMASQHVRRTTNWVMGGKGLELWRLK